MRIPQYKDNFIILVQILHRHIGKCLPELKKRVKNKTQLFQDEIDNYGATVTDKVWIVCNKKKAFASLLTTFTTHLQRETTLRIIEMFSTAYCSAIEGTADTENDLKIDELECGARICCIFHEDFSAQLDDIEQNTKKILTPKEILTAVKNIQV